MAIDFGTGVSRTLDAAKRQFSAVVYQKGKPPLDSELNLVSQVESEALRQAIRNLMPSGFLTDPTRSFADYQFDPLWANRFRLGNPRQPQGFLEGSEKDAVVWANVNGWLIPVVGTNVEAEGELFNVIDLNAPPETDSRVDFVFLEAWQTRVDPNPSTARKPSASTLWKYGNVLYGGTNIADDLEDPTIGFETTGRIQTQYRLRVFGQGIGAGTSVPLQVYPDGLGYSLIHGQGTAASPVAALGAFTNMREELGDPSLWRAGDGNPNNGYGTVDGYVYAIPVCAIFRRASNPYQAVNGASPATQNGAFDRTPSSKVAGQPSSKNLTQMTLAQPLSPTGTTIVVSGLSGSGLDDPQHVLATVFLVIDDEIVGVSAIDPNLSTITIPAGGRGRYGTAAVGHKAGTSIKFYNTRPDGLYADQIAATDVLDLRHAVNAQDWDYNRLLAYNVGELVKGTLRSAWKLSAAGDTQGPVVHEVDYMYANNAPLAPPSTTPIDGPDGVRTIFSDAATIQPDVTLLLDNLGTNPGNNYADDTLTTEAVWGVAPGFHPSGYMNGGTAFTDGTAFFLYTGGNTGNEGARYTFRTGGTRGVRVLTPREYWKAGYPAFNPNNGNQTPVTLRFLGQRALEAAPATLNPNFAPRHVGPMFPTRETNFERPFIVLGGLLNPSFKIANIDVDTQLVNIGPGVYEIDLGVGFDFDTPGIWYTLDANLDPQDDPALLAAANRLFHGTRTLYGMLTDGGRDFTGASSEIYIVLHGDTGSKANNGAFKVVGAGTRGYTSNTASTTSSLVVVPLSPEFDATGFEATGNTIRAEIRSQYTHVEDLSAYNASVLNGTADVVIVLTDVGGQTETPWKQAYLGHGAPDNYDLSLPMTGTSPDWPDLQTKLALNITLLYHPGHGGTARVADQIVRFARTKSFGVPDSRHYLRQCPANVDPTFPGSSGAPSDEIVWPINHVQLWNRLPSLGWNAPIAPNYGGNVVGFTEQDREHELFVDAGSKTIVFRPFRSRNLTMQAETFTDSLGASVLSGCLLGSYNYNTAPPIAKDDLQMFTGTGGSGKLMGVPVPPEFMPRFGRQDIPYHRYDGESPMVIMPGINHLFRDSADISSLVFNIVGGTPTTLGTAAVNNMLFIAEPVATATTGATYGKAGTTIAGTNNQAYIGARLTSQINPMATYGQEVIDKFLAVNSSDFGRGLRGIQLPPYYGIARLYGVYDSRDFVTKGGRTISPTDRYSPDGNNAAPNLLREDVDRQTLFIMQDGAKDYTGETGDHTYVIPENVLDLSRCLNWDPNNPTDFNDFNFVVVCSVFGFAKDWINGNNLVLVRRFNGLGNENLDGDNPLLESVPMIIPCPAGAMDEFYVAYNRTAYQGDVFMTRKDTLSASDYQARYGQLTIPQQYAMRWPIQQYDANGNYVPQTPNPRTFEVLASMDFYTTMGTGKIGGQMYPGTMLDVCYTQNTPDAAKRYPGTLTDPMTGAVPMWQMYPRAYTEGQKGSDNRARLDLALLDPTQLDLGVAPADRAIIRFTLVDDTVAQLWFALPSNYAAMVAGVGAENVVLVDETIKPVEYLGSYTYPTPKVLAPNEAFTATTTVTGAQVGDAVVLDHAADPHVVIHGYVSAADTVTLTALNVFSPSAFELLDTAHDQPAIKTATLGTIIGGPAAAIAPGAYSLLGLYTFPGVIAPGTPAQAVFVNYVSSNLEDGLLFVGTVLGANQIAIRAFNPTANPITPDVTSSVRMVALENFTATNFQQDISGLVVNVRVFQDPHNANPALDWALKGEALVQTAKNLVGVINAHPKISKSVTAAIEYGSVIHLQAVPTGAEGNKVKVTLGHTEPAAYKNILNIMRVEAPYTNDAANTASVRSYTASNLVGGRDIPVNAGAGVSQIKLTGMTERLPLGALLQDSDFLCENPLNDQASAMKSSPVGPRAIQSILPLTNGGEEYTRFFGVPGELVVQSDGAVMTTDFGAWRRNNVTGSRVFRLYRGGGPLFVLGGDAEGNPGGPVDWVSESFPASIMPVLKGGVLVCRAMLVRNFYEETSGQRPNKKTDGDEIQMVIATYGILGNDHLQQDGLTLSGVISPAGYGEGYASADRYRLAGRPMFKGTTRQVPDPADVTLAVYPDGIRS